MIWNSRNDLVWDRKEEEGLPLTIIQFWRENQRGNQHKAILGVPLPHLLTPTRLS